MNPYGHVVSENVDGVITVNGHSYADPALRSQNTNFALLVSNRFTKPFDQPYQYGKHIAALSNMLGGGVLVQRFGDLIKGVRTNDCPGTASAGSCPAAVSRWPACSVPRWRPASGSWK